MNKLVLFLFFFLYAFKGISSQEIQAYDTLKIGSADDFLIDDYGALYLYHAEDFSLTKQKLDGEQLGRLVFTVPFKVQSVQNPLNIPLFSQNAQELRFADQNLNLIQTLSLREFGFVTMSYAEDQQQVWLLDSSARRLIQYNFRDRKIINAFSFDIDFEHIRDMIVYRNTVYLLFKDLFAVYSLQGNPIFSAKIDEARRLRRENNEILISSRSAFYQYRTAGGTVKIFERPTARIVDKNSQAFLAAVANNLYLYRPAK